MSLTLQCKGLVIYYT